MVPGKLDLTLYRGSTFGPIHAVCKDSTPAVVNLTGYVAEAQVRTAYNKPLILDLAPTIPVPANGTIIIYFTDEATKAIMSPGNGDYVWDMFLTSPSGERLGPFLAGTFTIKTGVTKP